MPIHTFKSAHKLVTGFNASKQLAKYCHDLNMSKVLILTDHGILNSGS